MTRRRMTTAVGRRDRGRCSHFRDRKSTRLNSSHLVISYAVFCLKKKKNQLDVSFPRCRRLAELDLARSLYVCARSSPLTLVVATPLVRGQHLPEARPSPTRTSR